jgi:hypothetical protein
MYCQLFQTVPREQKERMKHMGKITISLSENDETKLRERAIKNYRSISREISYMLWRIEQIDNT